MAEIKPSAAAVSVAASRIACASLPPWAFTRSIVSLRKITEIIWKVEALPSPAVRNSTINTAKKAIKLPPWPLVGRVRNSSAQKTAITTKLTSVTRVPPRRSEIAPPIERASAPMNGPKKA